MPGSRDFSQPANHGGRIGNSKRDGWCNSCIKKPEPEDYPVVILAVRSYRMTFCLDCAKSINDMFTQLIRSQ